MGGGPPGDSEPEPEDGHCKCHSAPEFDKSSFHQSAAGTVRQSVGHSVALALTPRKKARATGKSILSRSVHFKCSAAAGGLNGGPRPVRSEPVIIQS